jgi:hypothetical protein
MDLIGLIIILIVVGAVLYLIEQLLPIDPSIKLIIRVVIIVVLLLWLVRVFLGGSILLPRVG